METVVYLPCFGVPDTLTHLLSASGFGFPDGLAQLLVVFADTARFLAVEGCFAVGYLCHSGSSAEANPF